MIDSELVETAYRLLLGREPENQEVVQQYLSLKSLHELREVFLRSAEFRNMVTQHVHGVPAAPARVSFNSPNIPVEASADARQLEAMFERVRLQWERLGEKEPYWSVITSPNYRQETFADHREHFFSSGKYSRDVFLAALRRSGINPNRLESCLEVGCGVGRVTRYLAESFPQVVATDISAHHLSIAREYLASERVDNVRLDHWRDVSALAALPKVDAIFSVIVLQHNPPPVMAWMLAQLLGALKPGGVAWVQLPTYKSGYLFEVERFLDSVPNDGMDMHFLPQPEVFRLIATAGCLCLEVREDGIAGAEDAIVSNSFVIQRPAA